MSGPAKAVVLAAGLSTRLGGAAAEPKPLLRVGGMPILHRVLNSLRAAGVRKIVVVVGHRAEEIVSSLNDFSSSLEDGVIVEHVFSDRYRLTNNLYSLWLAREHLHEDVYLLDGDVVFDPDLPRALDLADEESVAAVLPGQPGMTGTMVEVDGESRIVRMVDVRSGGPGFPAPYKTCSVYLLRAGFLQAEFVPGLERFVSEGRVQEFYEAVLADVIGRGRDRLRAVDCRHFRWCEVDDTNDWTTAEYVFSNPEQRFALLAHGHGGFQRQGVVDHLVMTNVYFPPEPLQLDLQRELVRVATDYPAGQATLARLMAGVVGAPASCLIVANGASELIKIICGSVTRRALVAVPAFNEYEQALLPDQLVRFQLGPPTFRLDPEAFYRAADNADVELAVVASPNNPTSQLVPRDALLALCESFARRGTLFLVDESFVDFCADPGSQSLRSAIDAHPNLVVVKSFSMSCGIPGLRLACLLTANVELATDVRARIPIWNVNGVAEAFLRLLPGYRATLEESCRRVRKECDELALLLGEIPGVEVPPPSANFCFVRLPQGADGPGVARRLFVEHDLLVKDCSGKSMPEARGYLRIKSRTPTENSRLASALEHVLAHESNGHAAAAAP
jgi:histidinol-phosphate/aromatic aminotransferase/cobyric acid decarboxylase-like protein/NDP-sugar pyrophosphorylase family protein